MLSIGDHELSDAYNFFSASEFISDDREHPTIFQNLFTHILHAGKQFNIPGLGTYPMPFEQSVSAFTEAVGYITGDKFVGTMRLSYDIHLSKMTPQIRQVLGARFGNIPDQCHMTGAGRFEVSLLQDT